MTGFEYDPVWLERQQRDMARHAMEIMERDLRRPLSPHPPKPEKPAEQEKPA